MPEITKEMLDNVVAKMTEVSDLLKNCPTPEEINKAVTLSKEATEKVEKFSGGEGLEEAVKAAVEKALEPLEARLKEVEEAPLIKGMQDFDIQKLKKAGTVPEAKPDILGGVLKCAFPENVVGD